MAIYTEGLLIGLTTFIIIGCFHPIVIKAEYYFGTRIWWVFLIVGIGAIIGALLTEQIYWSSILGILGFSCFWSILEVFAQKKRVQRGWFPMNPKRKKDYEK